MSGGIVSYYGDDGDAAEELEALGDSYMVGCLRYLQKIAEGEIDHRALREYSNFFGVPLFKAQNDGRIMVFGVEEEADGGRKVTILYAGRQEIEVGLEMIVNARAAEWFSILRA